MYVGSGVNIENRWSVHKTLLKKGIHHSSKLQRAWDKYGSEEFLFEIIEVCSRSRLIKMEQKYLNMFADQKNYNCQPRAFSPLGYKHTEATKKKLRKACRWWVEDPEYQRRKSERVKAQHAAGKFGQITWKGPANRNAPKSRRAQKANGKKLKLHIAAQSSEEMGRRSRCRKDAAGAMRKVIASKMLTLVEIRKGLRKDILCTSSSLLAHAPERSAS